MASKKYLLFAGIFCLLASSGFSQRLGASYDVKDSSLIPSKRLAQHSEFLNGTYNFPAKPRNQWEIGIKAGLFRLSAMYLPNCLQDLADISENHLVTFSLCVLNIFTERVKEAFRNWKNMALQVYAPSGE